MGNVDGGLFALDEKFASPADAEAVIGGLGDVADGPTPACRFA